jgi:phosphatidylglycerophosphate synthase
MTASPTRTVEPPVVTGRPRYRETVRRMGGAQKSSKGGPAYSVYVNRRFGRWAAAAAFTVGLTPNAVTAISATFSFAAIVVIALVSGWAAAIAAPLLAVGYFLDAADGQLARLRGGGSPAGEWLDHMVDSVKITTLHLAVLIHLWRFTDVDRGWLLVPMGFVVVAVTLFFAQLLNEQLRRNARTTDAAAPIEKASPVSALLKLPHDYGVLCWIFLLLGDATAFLAAYTFLFVFNAGYLALALFKWYRDMRALSVVPR